MPDPTFKPRRANKADMPRMAEALVRSFAREPFHQWMVPDADQWGLRAPRYFKSYIKIVARDGYADTVDGGLGAALWLSPDKHGAGFLSRFQVPFVLWRLAGSKFPDVWSAVPLIERHRPQHPHWYLDILGVDPSESGKGVGSALLQYGLKRCDAGGKAVFLDTLEERNVRFYERHGFKVTAHFDLPSGLPVWTMLRDPQTAT